MGGVIGDGMGGYWEWGGVLGGVQGMGVTGGYWRLLGVPADPAPSLQPNVEMLWAMRASQHAEVYFNVRLHRGCASILGTPPPL